MTALGTPRMLLCSLLLFGYTLCSVLATPKLLFSNNDNICVVDAAEPLPEGTERQSTVILPNLPAATAVDFLYRTDKDGNDNSVICWGDAVLPKIACVTRSNNRLSSPKGIVTTGLRYPDGIGIDWVTDKLYWVDAKRHRIEVCELNSGNNRKVLYWTRLDQLRALALDPFSGYMYWTDWGAVAKIERGAMNGDQTLRSELVTKDIVWPNGLTIDFQDRRIYWSDAQLNILSSMAMDGSDRRVVKSDNLPHPYGVAVYGNHLYWTDWKEKSILRCNKTRCATDSEVILSHLRYPMDINIFEPSSQPMPEYNPCGRNNGGCSHLCLLAPANSINCACPSGIMLKEDNKTCAETAMTMLFLARNSDIRAISLDSSDFTDKVLPVDKVSHAITIDFDPVNQFVYWTDDEVRLIQRAKLDGTQQEAVVTAEVFNPDGIAVDWVSGNLYWTDTGTDRIEVARLNGTSRRTIVSSNLIEPRAITVDPINGWIYWTDWGKPAKIEKAFGDGTNRTVIIDTDLQWPNGIAIDSKQNKLYWPDAMSDRIERANLDGSGREVVLEIKYSHIFGFDIIGDYMYWTDWQRRKLERKRLSDRNGSIELITDQLSDLMGIRTVNMIVDDTVTNDCSFGYGGCSHLCLPTPLGIVCSCPMGMELLPDNKTCIVPEAFLVFSQETMIKTASIQFRHKETQLPIQRLANVTSVDIHIERELLYFSDTLNSSIRQAYLNGSSVQVVLELVNEDPGPIAIDWISDNIYFIEQSRRRIEVYNIRTKARKIVLWSKLGTPYSLAVHPRAGYLYWTDLDQDGQDTSVIGRSKLTGEEQLFILTNIGRCGSITVDLDSDRIYWINYDRKSIQSAGLSGEHMEEVKAGLTSPVTMNIYGSYIYWFDDVRRQIRRVNKINTTDELILQDGIHSMVNLIVHHHSRQSGWSKCKNDNGGCEYFCFSADDSSTDVMCGCPTHYRLNRDNKTCSAPNHFLLLSERPYNTISCHGSKCKEVQIMRILDENVPDVILPMSSLKSVNTIEFDPDNNKIYWVDGAQRAVQRSSVDGTQMEVFIQHNTLSPSSIALDPYSRRLFWSDYDNGVINVTKLDQSPVGIIIHRADVKPKALAIHPYKGFLFIVTGSAHANRNNTVLRCTLDGKNLVTIIKDHDIRAFAVDPQNDRIYYSEFLSKSILSSRINGTDVKLLVSDVRADALTIYNDKLYYTQGTNLLYVDKDSGQNTRLIARDLANITDLHAVNAYAFIDRLSHPCAINNGDCSHICFVDEAGQKQCGCPQGLQLNYNKMNCDSPPTCRTTDFTCDSGKVPCVPSVWVCDGKAECEDGSDEKNCPPQCKKSEFRCHSGECVNSSRLCNNIADCVDSSDESCCAPENYRCPDTERCIPTSRLRDGVNDCTDGSDEKSQEATSTVESHKAKDPYAVGVIVVLCIVSIAIICLVVFIVWRCHKRTSLQYMESRSLDQIRPVTMTDPGSLAGPTSTTLPQSVTATTVISASSTSGGLYDRTHITGASSSSSSMTHLQPGYNPPPSPVTERSARLMRHPVDDDLSTVVSSACPSYHTAMKRGRMHAPPTTPISTCDDSEPSVVNYTTHKPRFKKKSNKSYQLLGYGSSEPYPPPPTPTRSRVYSGDEASECPPSPSTVRSFRSVVHNPYPPPPSPEPTSDNS